MAAKKKTVKKKGAALARAASMAFQARDFGHHFQQHVAPDLLVHRPPHDARDRGHASADADPLAPALAHHALDDARDRGHATSDSE